MTHQQNILFLRHGYAGMAMQTSTAFGVDEKDVALNEGKHVSKIGETLNKLVIACVNHEHFEQGNKLITRVIRSDTDRTAETATHVFPELEATVDMRAQPYYASALNLHAYGIHHLLEELRKDGQDTAVITHDFVPFLAAYLTTEQGRNSAASIIENHNASTGTQDFYERFFLKGHAKDIPNCCDRNIERQFRRHCESTFNLREARNSGGVLLHYDGDQVTVTYIHPPTIVKQLLEEAATLLPSNPPSPALAPLRKIIEKTDEYAFNNFSPYRCSRDDFNALKIVTERFSNPENAPQEGLLSDPKIREHFCDFLSQAAEMGISSLQERTNLRQ